MTASRNQPSILVGICGGIAAYKAVEVVSKLRQQGHDVHVVMSQAAQRFVTPLTFAGVSGNRVITDLFPDGDRAQGEDAYPHLYPATRADLFVLLPATADMMARIAQGSGPEIVSTCVLSLPPACRRIFCPAMNVEMWEQESVQHNVRTLESLGWERIGPDRGALACGMEGPGRMSEPAEILRIVSAALASAHSFDGRNVLILSGPTREHFDPVRYIGNASSGKMGKALAEEAMARGAQVTFVSGPVDTAQWPRGPRLHPRAVTSAEEMLTEADASFKDADLVIFAAAVADYMPEHNVADKRPKSQQALNITLKPTPDIAAMLGRKKNGKITIGFALQTDAQTDAAQAKRKAKQLDAIVLNQVDAMGADSARYRFIDESGVTSWGELTKRDCARRILDEAAKMLKG